MLARLAALFVEIEAEQVLRLQVCGDGAEDGREIERRARIKGGALVGGQKVLPARALGQFTKAACGPAPDEAKIELYAQRSLEHREWLVARGVEFLGTVFPHASGTSPVDGEGLMFTGGENAYPYDEIATPATRGHVVQGGRPGGGVLMRLLADAACAGISHCLAHPLPVRLRDEDDDLVLPHGTAFIWRPEPGTII